MFDGWEAQAAVVARIAFAMLLGGVIGLEREMKDRPASARTRWWPVRRPCSPAWAT